MIKQIQQLKAQNRQIKPGDISVRFGLSIITAKKYLNMTETDVKRLDNAHPNRVTRTRLIDGYVNIIYKMLRDGIDDVTIFHYIRQEGVIGASDTIWRYIQSIAVRNFPGRKVINPMRLYQVSYSNNVIVIKRTSLLKYILTVNPKTPKDETIRNYIDLIKSDFPVVERVQTIFQSFHGILTGGEPNALYGFLSAYGESEISGFCDGIKNDIVPVINSATMETSSGFVEGCNNKFKLIKRIMYGRAKLQCH